MKAVGPERVVCVLNNVTGTIEELPFDLRKRRVIAFTLRQGDDKAEPRKELVGKLKRAIRDILDLPSAILDLQFADSKSHAPLGCNPSLANTVLTYDENTLPQVQDDSTSNYLFSGILTERTNRNYYEEKANYLIAREFVKPVCLRVDSGGGRLMSNVRFVAAISLDDTTVALEEHELPEVPKRSVAPFESNWKPPQIGKTYPGAVELAKRGDTCNLEVQFGNIQPRAKAISEAFYLGAANRSVVISGSLFADELSKPIPVALSISFETTRREFCDDDWNAELPGD